MSVWLLELLASVSYLQLLENSILLELRQLGSMAFGNLLELRLTEGEASGKWERAIIAGDLVILAVIGYCCK